MIYSIIIKGEIINRKSYSGDFEKKILKELDSDNIKDYAESYLDMIDEDDIDENPELHEIEDIELIECLEDRGFIVILPRSIVEASKIESLKESLNLE